MVQSQSTIGQASYAAMEAKLQTPNHSYNKSAAVYQTAATDFRGPGYMGYSSIKKQINKFPYYIKYSNIREIHCKKYIFKIY